jgi:hypothetical protein
MIRKLVVTSIAAMALLCGGLSTNAGAEGGLFNWDVILTVPDLATQPDDAHLQLSAIGVKLGEIKSPFIASLAVNDDSINVYLSQKATPGMLVRFHFTSDNPGVEFLGGVWLNDEIVVGQVQPHEVLIRPKTQPAIPGVNSVGLILLSLLTLGSGIFVLGRRRTATA